MVKWDLGKHFIWNSIANAVFCLYPVVMCIVALVVTMLFHWISNRLAGR